MPLPVLGELMAEERRQLGEEREATGGAEGETMLTGEVMGACMGCPAGPVQCKLLGCLLNSHAEKGTERSIMCCTGRSASAGLGDLSL